MAVPGIDSLRLLAGWDALLWERQDSERCRPHPALYSLVESDSVAVAKVLSVHPEENLLRSCRLVPNETARREIHCLTFPIFTDRTREKSHEIPVPAWTLVVGNLRLIGHNLGG
jgi:hypothetical protein